MGLEIQLQSKIFLRAWNEYPHTRGCLFRVRNEERKMPNESIAQFRRRLSQNLATGVVPGVSDFVMFWYGKLYAFELKVAGRKQSESQHWWQGVCYMHSVQYELFDTEEDFFAVFENIVGVRDNKPKI